MASCVVAYHVLVAVSNPMPHCFANVNASIFGFHAEDCAEQMQHDNSPGSMISDDGRDTTTGYITLSLACFGSNMYLFMLFQSI
jgi:hypothetical protein